MLLNLSIAPSLELKHHTRVNVSARLIFYQSHHLWNWNKISACGGSASPPLSIAPSLELKPVSFGGIMHQGAFYQSHHLWNWNKELRFLQIKHINLSIAPSLELKPTNRQPDNCRLEPYQSHHLWNWNDRSKCQWWYTYFLSIAPSLELKQWMRGIPQVMAFAINRTISGIETVIASVFQFFNFLYQSHHLWNWNDSFTILLNYHSRLSIAPSLELKLCSITALSLPKELSIAPSLELKLLTRPNAS